MTANNNEASPRRADLGHQIAVRAAVVAGLFSALVGAALVADYGRRQLEDPLEAEEFQELKKELAQRPDDEELQSRIRTLDLQLREEYFRARRFAERGTWILLGGAVVFLIAAKSASTLRRKLPTPGPQATRQDAETPRMRIARYSVGVLVLLLLGTVPVLKVSFHTELAPLSGPQEPQPEPGQVAGPSGEDGYPSDEEIGKNWPRFRGPGGLGISAYDNVPTSWDASSGEGILWKTPVPLPGNNSPVVWGDRVFLSGASEARREVYCFNTRDGKLLWQKEVPSTAQETLDPDSINEKTGLAAPTTATDGKRVFALFANGDTAAFDFAGQLVWSRSLGIPDNHYGHASSLEIYRHLLLIQFDQGGTVKQGKSKLLALDTLTGKTVYEVARPVSVSWTSPCLTSVKGRVQLITCADPWAIAYDPADGSEIWRAEVLSGECGPSPVAVDGVVHVGNQYCLWSWIRADGEGNVTDTHVLQTAEDGLPDVCSPLVVSGYLFLVASDLLSCYDAKTAELLWDTYGDKQHQEIDFATSFTSSPSWAAGRVYLFGEDGRGWIIEPTREKANVVAETALGEECATSPAFQDGRIYIRGQEHLFCLGQ